MRTKRKNNRAFFLAIILLTIFTLSPVALLEIFNPESPKASAYEEETITGYTEWTTDQQIDKYITIDQEATLVIKKGIHVTFKEGGVLNVEGKLYSRGTKNNPVIFRKEGVDKIPLDEEGYVYEYDGYSIYVYGEAHFKDTDISGGGNIFPYQVKNNSFFNTVYAAGEYGAVYVSGGGKLTMEECNVHDNIGGIQLYYFLGNNIKVNKTIFEDNIYFDEKDSGLQGSSFPDFQNNWWRGPNGPEKTGWNYNPYKYIGRNINFNNWLTSKTFHDPVIIIPGILGSEQKDGTWQIDPVFHTYDNLYEEFVENGYIPDVDIFVFPYDWRKSNAENAELLRLKIKQINQQQKWPYVDLVAHSMGGLLARKYIESPSYNNDVDQLITLGTPNNGAPEAYLKWEAGAFTLSIADIYLKSRFSQEAEENDFDDIFHYIHEKPIISVQELLPVYGYLYEVEDRNQLRTYSTNYPVNTFLEDLNSDALKKNLLKVEMDKIIGNVGNDSSTVAGFKVVDADMGEYWVHGYPHGFEIPIIGDRGITYGNGDGTVPLESAQSINIFADEEIEINSAHRELPTNAQKDILKLLTGNTPNNEVRHSIIRDMLIISVFSPIDIQVIAPDGKSWAGKNIQNLAEGDKIEDTYYSGYAGVENEFLTIPDPDDGEYTIITEKTGIGTYTIKVAKISEVGSDSSQASESEKVITGDTTTELYETKTVRVLGNEVLIGDEDNTPPEITSSISPTPNENGWNISDVSIHFEATDSESGLDEDKTSNVILLQDEGANQSASWTTNDKAGNESTKNITGINIDKTAPATEAIFSGTKGKNSWHIGDIEISLNSSDLLSGTEKTFYALDNQDFQEGTRLTVADEGIRTIKYYSKDLAGNIETVKTAEFKLDKTAPEIQILSPKNETYFNDDILKINYTISDLLTPENKVNKIITLDNQILNKDEIDLSLEDLGNHNIVISAEDEAGNQSSERVEFIHATNIDSIISNVKHYCKLGLIKNIRTEIELEIKLRNIKSEMQLLNFFENKWMPKWAKERVIENLKMQINHQIDMLINQIKSKKDITSRAKEFLTESLEAIKE